MWHFSSSSKTDNLDQIRNNIHHKMLLVKEDLWSHQHIPEDYQHGYVHLPCTFWVPYQNSFLSERWGHKHNCHLMVISDRSLLFLVPRDLITQRQLSISKQHKHTLTDEKPLQLNNLQGDMLAKQSSCTNSYRQG